MSIPVTHQYLQYTFCTKLTLKKGRQRCNFYPQGIYDILEREIRNRREIRNYTCSREKRIESSKRIESVTAGNMKNTGVIKVKLDYPVARFLG